MTEKFAKITRGSPEKLGAHFDGKGINFALFSANGEKVELCLFSSDGKHETRVELPARTGDIWHGYIEGLKPGQLYGYRVHGPYEPENGHRFNPHKLLLDPYARELAGEFVWNDTHYGFIQGHPDEDLSYDTRDNAPYMVKGRVTSPEPAATSTTATDWRDTIIYEAHVRGMTMEHPDVPEKVRGRFKGVADDAIIRHLKKLGVTTVELLPVQAFLNDHFHVKGGRRNYWGYNTLGFFAPEQRYGNTAEFRAMVEKFHRAGIEVMLDVVYNHTFEGHELGPTVSFRGIDNASYYRLVPGNERQYIDDTGCGNTINTDHPQVRRMLLDSLRYWAKDMGVDGFRFDLATILGRHTTGFDRNHPFFTEVRNDPVLSTKKLTKKKLVAEPWDIGPGGYQLGNFPSDWHEWNDIYRDETRGFWHGHENHIGKIAYGLTGSRNHFSRKDPGPSASINAITFHDGFTLHDLVSYSRKHNHANGEDNRDGHGNNTSDNHGVEGETSDPSIIALRERQKRNFMATLMLSQGTPLMLSGDEMGNSQQGNNNAYCQDNKIGWVNWQDKTQFGKVMENFTCKVIALRKKYPILNPPVSLDGVSKDADGVPDITWYTPHGEEKREEHWRDPHARTIGVLFNSSALPARHRTPETGNEKLLLIFNAYGGNVPFKLPTLPHLKGWQRILDTAEPALSEGDDTKLHHSQSAYPVTGKSVLVFKAVPG